MKKFLFKLLVLATASTGITSEVYLLESLKTAPTGNAVESTHQVVPNHSAVLKPHPANRPRMNEDKQPDDPERTTADDASAPDTEPTKMKTGRGQFYRGISIYQWVYLF